MTRRLLVGTGWKMNHGIAETRSYGQVLRSQLRASHSAAVDIFVLPPFTALAAAVEALAGSPVGVGGQNLHWEESGAWTGEISAGMLAEAGCRYVELAHSERLQHFNETYALVRLKVNAALKHGLIPVLCLGETAAEKAAGHSAQILTRQVETALADLDSARLPQVVLAYEPRWAIGQAQSASAEYAESQHRHLRSVLTARWGVNAAEATRIIYGGSVSPATGPDLIRQPNIDGLFIGRAAWQPAGFAQMIEIVATAAAAKNLSS